MPRLIARTSITGVRFLVIPLCMCEFIMTLSFYLCTQKKKQMQPHTLDRTAVMKPNPMVVANLIIKSEKMRHICWRFFQRILVADPCDARVWRNDICMSIMVVVNNDCCIRLGVWYKVIIERFVVSSKTKSYKGINQIKSMNTISIQLTLARALHGFCGTP
jgi:hypothetical protein